MICSNNLYIIWKCFCITVYMKLSELLAWARDPTPFLFEIVYTLKPLIEDTFVGNKIVDHSDVAGASPVGAAPTTSSFST